MKSVNVNRLPQDAPGSGWYEILPPPPPATQISGEIRADWALIGAGFAGLAAARRLAELRPEDHIVLIEAQRVGFGAAGRNSGFMIDLPHDLNTESYTGSQEEDRKLIRLNRAAIAYARRVVKDNGIECDWREDGKIHAAITPEGGASLEAFMQGLDALGEPYSALDTAALKRITGTDCFRSGVHTPGAVLIQPAAFTRGAAASMPENVTVYEESPVTSLSGPDPFQLDCPGGRVKAKRLLLTNNGYAATFGFLSGRLIHVCTYGSMTRPLSEVEQATLGGELSWGLIPANPLGTTVRRLHNHRIIIRNTFTYNPPLHAYGGDSGAHTPAS